MLLRFRFALASVVVALICSANVSSAGAQQRPQRGSRLCRQNREPGGGRAGSSTTECGPCTIYSLKERDLGSGKKNLLSSVRFAPVRASYGRCPMDGRKQP
jgi:hypothetical protein